MLFIVLLNPSLDDTRLYLNCERFYDSEYDNVFTCKTEWEDPEGLDCTDYQYNDYCTDTGREYKDDSDPNHFIFEINVGQGRIRHRTILNLKDNFSVVLYRFRLFPTLI